MKRVVCVAALLGVVGVTVLGVVGCGFHHKSADEKAEWIGEKIEDRLDLTEAQRPQLDALEREMKALHGEHRTLRRQHLEQLGKMLDSPTLDRKQAVAMVGEKSGFITAHAERMVEAVANLYDTLSDEQRAELREFIDRHAGHDGHHW